MYKVTEYLEERGKTKVKYYKVKFKNTGNEDEFPEKTILENRVVDKEAKKKATKKRNRQNKKAIKQEKKEFKSYVINLGAEPRALSLDMSTFSTGFAVFIGDKLVDYGYIYQPKSVKWDTKRISHMKKEIARLVVKYNINCVCMENVIFKTRKVLYALSKLQGVVAEYLYTEKHIPYALIEPISWKRSADINRGGSYEDKEKRIASKEKTVDVVKIDYGIDLREKFKDSPSDLSEICAYDVADAIELGKIFIRDRVKSR